MRDYVTGEHFQILQCARCGFGLTDPVPLSMDRYYPPRYRRFNALAAFVLRRLYLRRVDGWHARLPLAGVALELGTGMFHVLEHLSDPLTALTAVARRVKPGGTLILGIPNIASWQARSAGPFWMHLEVPRHLCHFSPDAIERALGASGFRMTRLDFRSFEHDPFGWVQSTLDRLGFEQSLLVKLLARMQDRRSDVLSTLVASVLAIPLGALGLVLALASWRAGAGAVMEVWATREDRPAG